MSHYALKKKFYWKKNDLKKNDLKKIKKTLGIHLNYFCECLEEEEWYNIFFNSKANEDDFWLVQSILRTTFTNNHSSMLLTSPSPVEPYFLTAGTSSVMRLEEVETAV